VSIDRTTRSEVPVGIGPETDGPSWVAGAPLLGRLTAAVAVGLAELAERMGTTDVRLTPWRTVLLAGIPSADTRAAARELDGLGLTTDATDPTLRVTACAGSSGCTEGRADTQADGRRLVELLRERPGANVVHLAGCPKRCGNGRPEATLVSDQAKGRYDLVEWTPSGEVLVARDLDVEAALHHGHRP
jgi:precorrin-3B synthase